MKHYILLLFCIFLQVSIVIEATPSANILSLENEFIKIIVNNNKEDQGRFSLETTLGDPDNTLDDFQPLIYGRPTPWTSYTTLKIDNKNLIFGGKSLKTERRVPEKLTYGTVKSQELTDTSLKTVVDFEKISVLQTLTFLRNPSTRVNDMAKITYAVTNMDTKPHSVGLRIMLDTKLGSNDGAPFRMGSTSITSEKKVVKPDLIDYWQAFDSLITPNIIAQGLVSSFEQLISPPDSLLLANWGTLVDHPWEFTYQDNRSFIREGEYEKDTALAMYWNAITLQPNETQYFSTAYGLGGISLSAGELSLGISSPAEYFTSSKQPFFIIAYLYNKGGFASKSTKISITLPEGLSLVDGNLTSVYDNVKPDSTLQIPLKVKMNEKAKEGKHNIAIDVSSKTLEGNHISRPIQFLSPPSIKAAVEIPKQHVLNIPGIPITMTITNPYQKALHNVEASLSLPSSLSLLSLDTNNKKVPLLNPDETITFNWMLEHHATTPSFETITAHIKAEETKKMTFSNDIQFMHSPTIISVKTPLSSLILNAPTVMALSITSSKENNGSIKLSYDRDFLNISTIIPTLEAGKTFIETGSNTITLSNIPSFNTHIDHILAHLYLTPIKSGTTELLIKQEDKVESILSLKIQEEKQ